MPGARNGFPVYVFAKYDKNTNCAIKGVISAQRVLGERYDMCAAVSPAFRANRNEVTLKLTPLEGSSEPPHISNPDILDAAEVPRAAALVAGKIRIGEMYADLSAPM